MNQIIKDILGNDPLCRANSKMEELKAIEKDIETAYKVLNGELTYCEDCDDFYLTKSFIKDARDENITVCTYRDPINSGGNEYEEQLHRHIYSICPKGHEKLINIKDI